MMKQQLAWCWQKLTIQAVEAMRLSYPNLSKINRDENDKFSDFLVDWAEILGTLKTVVDLGYFELFIHETKNEK